MHFKSGALNLLITILVLISPEGFPQDQPKVNSQKLAKLKTAFIYKFTQNIYWPNEDNMKEFVICVMSDEQMAEQLAELEKVAKFRNRIPIRVRFCRTADESAGAQMVVVDGAGNMNLWSVYSKIRGKAVLMVAENLSDFKKSMISFVIADSKMKYIVNSTKLGESNLVVKEDLYKNAIKTEGDWNSIFEKFKYLVEHGDKKVQIDKSDIAQWMSEYSTLQKEKNVSELTLAQMGDSMKAKMAELDDKMRELESVSHKIERQKQILGQLNHRMKNQEGQILVRDTEIGKQRLVIFLIAGLTLGVLVLLLLALRVNSQRRKANRLLMAQKREIEEQKHLIEEKQKEILDSINYAKRIQHALMANDRVLQEHLPEHFVYFRPKDIVAGDFYWAEPVDGSLVYVTADSTGHGVPGAFMSLLNISKLNEVINQRQILRPDLVLNEVKKEIIGALNPAGSTEVSRDGMDAVLCRLDRKNNTLQYAAANHNFYIVRKGQLMEFKGDKMPVGKSHDDEAPFTFNEVTVEPGDIIYTFTDGFHDQFGGPNGKKLKMRNLKDLLLEISPLPLSDQKKELDHRFETWKGALEQVDDVLVIGVRV